MADADEQQAAGGTTEQAASTPGENQTSETTQTQTTDADKSGEGNKAISDALASANETSKPDGQASEQQTDASKGAGEAPAYEPFTLPDGYEAQDSDLKVFTDLATELGADQEHAQKLIDLGVTLVQTSLQNDEQARVQELETLQNGWKDQLRNDPELGGEHWEETQRNADAFQKAGFASDELIAHLHETGQLVHPEIVRLFNTIGKALQENPIAFGSGDSPGGKTPAQRMFANSGLQ